MRSQSSEQVSCLGQTPLLAWWDRTLQGSWYWSLECEEQIVLSRGLQCQAWGCLTLVQRILFKATISSQDNAPSGSLTSLKWKSLLGQAFCLTLDLLSVSCLWLYFVLLLYSHRIPCAGCSVPMYFFHEATDSLWTQTVKKCTGRAYWASRWSKVFQAIKLECLCVNCSK